MNEEILLQQAGIHPTAARIMILRTLAHESRPLSMLEIGDILETVDKSVISRTLALFKVKHLVHTLEDGSESTRYELCTSVAHEHHNDIHVHFHCEKCGRTFCFEDIPIPEVKLPDGFESSYSNFIIKGICKECSKQ